MKNFILNLFAPTTASLTDTMHGLVNKLDALAEARFIRAYQRRFDAQALIEQAEDDEQEALLAGVVASRVFDVLA